MDFLDETAARLFLRKVGSGYSFILRRLQDYFADRYSELDGNANQETSQ